ncbi:hypothetical protein LNP74_10935 [Klebsiella pneumoniae subsp. pneumoniae]|nr:hypothetical protein [Klebsiella pneumoniae subsp. pneumoniae]
MNHQNRHTFLSLRLPSCLLSASPLLALVACVPLLAQAAPYQLTTAWPVNVGPLNPHLYPPNQMFAQSIGL